MASTRPQVRTLPWPLPLGVVVAGEYLTFTKQRETPAGWSPDGALEAFVELADDPSPTAITRYAKRYGLLGLCAEHGQPLDFARPNPHDPSATPCRPGLLSKTAAVEHDLTPGVPFEPVSGWRDWSGRARDLFLGIAAVLPRSNAKAPLEVWQRMAERQNYPLRGHLEAAAPTLVILELTEWLRDTGAGPFVEWDSDKSRPQLLSHDRTLLGHLGMQLTSMATGRETYALCDHCAQPFHPRSDWMTYCNKPECRTARKTTQRRAQRARARTEGDA